MAKSFSVIVTGANRGIGKAICESILQRPHNSNLILYACSRKGADLGFSTSNDKAQHDIRYPSLDIADAKSIDAFTSNIAQQKDQINVLINNAGVNLDDKPSLENTRRTLDVNYYGTLRLCQSILPHMAPDGRIVNLSSIASALRIYDEPIRERFRAAKTLEDLDAIIDDYLTYTKEGSAEKNGYGAPGRSYNVSKALINGATKILAEQHKSQLINCCCPGWIATDMGAMVGKPSKTPAQGAIIPVRLAFDDINNTTGKYWANVSIHNTGAGEVRKW